MTTFRNSSGEKFTAAVSTFVVLAVVAGVLTAQPAAPTVGEKLARLQSDLAFQLDLAYRLDHGARKTRQGEFDRAAAAWKTSPQTDADAALFAEWLHESIDRSLPARREGLPAPPNFGARPDPLAAGQQSAVASATADKAPPNLATPSAPDTGARAAGHDALRRPPANPPKQEPSRVAAAQPARPSAAQASPPTKHVVAKPVIDANALIASAAKASPAPHGKRPAASQPLAQSPPRLTPVAVNLAELNARITGFHEGLAEVMAAVVADRRRLSLDRLAALVGQIEQLAGERQFVALYYDSLSDDERRSVIAPRELGSAVKLLRAELKEATSAGDDDFLRPFEADERDVAALENRLQKLANAAGE